MKLKENSNLEKDINDYSQGANLYNKFVSL